MTAASNTINTITLPATNHVYEYWQPDTVWNTGSISTNWTYCTQHNCYNCSKCHHTTIITSPPEKIYMYQIICPKQNCGTSNWLELNKVTPCTKCKSKLKAVTEKIDFEVPVTTPS